MSSGSSYVVADLMVQKIYYYEILVLKVSMSG